MSPAAQLELRGVSKRFGRVRALRGIDLAVQEGEAVLIVGPNGAGKSTLLQLIAGLLRPDSGGVHLAGRPAGADPAGGRRSLGYAAHATMLYDSLSVRENLVFSGRLHGLARLRSRIDQLLRTFDLGDRADDQVGGLSRGLQQRAALARCFLHDPRLLLLDEPHGGLDRQAAAALDGLLQASLRKGRTLLLVTHDLARGWELASRVVVLRAGRIVLDRGRDGDFAAFEEALAWALAGADAAPQAPAG